MLASRVVVANPSVDTMSTASENSAQIYLVKSSISVMEGLECVNHLNNILSTDIRTLDKGMRIDGLICDPNGRVADIVNCYHMGNSILIVGIDSNSESTRELLTKGVPWDKKLSLLDGNGALEHLKIIGQDPSSLVIVLCIVSLDHRACGPAGLFIFDFPSSSSISHLRFAAALRATCVV